MKSEMKIIKRVLGVIDLVPKTTFIINQKYIAPYEVKKACFVKGSRK